MSVTKRAGCGGAGFALQQFIVFAGDNYYPGGGWDDFQGSYETLQEALTEAPALGEWWHIVDTKTGEVYG